MTEFIKRVAGTLRVIHAQNPEALKAVDALERGECLNLYADTPKDCIQLKIWQSFPEVLRMDACNPSLFGGTVRTLALKPEFPQYAGANA